MSKDTKLFTIAGTSTFRGKNTFRFATGNLHTRELVLKRNGHIDIKLQDLPNPMTKADAVAYLQSEEGIQAVMPKTGRGSAVKPEEIAAQEAIITARREEEAKAEEAVIEADQEFLNKLG